MARRQSSKLNHAGSNPARDTMKDKDVPRRFIIRPTAFEMKELGLEHDCYGVFFPDFGTYIIASEERGIDDFTGCPEDIEWLDEC